MKIYRSMFCESKDSMHPLKKVEIIDNDNMYFVQFYDVGFDPPYWDTYRMPLMHIDSKNENSFDEVLKYLFNEQSITINGWQIVEYPLYIVSNAVIRDEIKQNLVEEENFKLLVDQFISIETYLEAFAFLNKNDGSEYGGDPVYSRMIFQNYDQIFIPGFDSVTNLRSFENYGAFILGDRNKNTRNSELIGMDRMIIKGTNDNTSFSCCGSHTDDPICSVYDQDSKNYLSRGRLIKVIFNFFNKNETFIIDKKGFHRGADDGTLKWKIWKYDPYGMAQDDKTDGDRQKLID